MKTLEVKIAYLDDDFNIVERNKDFYTYFETVGFTYTQIDNLVAPEQKEKFLDFVKNNKSIDKFRVFRFKKITGEYFQNIVTVSEDMLNGKTYRSLHIVTIISAVDFIKESLAYEKFTAYALSLTNEFIFVYSQADHIFRMHNFMKEKNTLVYEQDIDSWKTQILEDGLISKKDTVEFETKINELKECRPSFSMKVNSSLRFSHSMFENLIFKAVRTEIDGETYMVGRMMPEIVVEQTQKSNEIIEELKIDSLTGTYNKKAILNFAQNRFVDGTKDDAMLAIVDLDHFKPVNDAYGHLAGDKVLAKAGEILKKIVGNNGVVGRYGGDEFLLVLEDMGQENVFRGLFRTICFDIEGAFKDMFTDIKVTASVGAAKYKKDGKNFDELFKKADFCLYRAKDKGRNRYVFFREDLHGELFKKASEAKTEGIKYDVREVLELKSMANFMLDLSESPKQAGYILLAHMLETYNLDSISIYYGQNMERKLSLGTAPDNLAEAKYVHTSEFKTAMNGSLFLRVDFTTDLPDGARPFGKILDDRGIKSTIQCVLGSLEKPTGLITFDRLKEGALWAEYEVNCCVMFGAAVNLLSEEKIQKLFA